MSNRNTLLQRATKQHSLFAGLACAATLTLAAGPALAQSTEHDHMKVDGRLVEAPVRRDIVAQCNDIGAQLNQALQTSLSRTHAEGSVRVHLLMEAGQIADVRARGVSAPVASAVRNAVKELRCGPQAFADAQIYRFTVAFVDQDADRNAGGKTMASAQPTITVAALANH